MWIDRMAAFWCGLLLLATGSGPGASHAAAEAAKKSDAQLSPSTAIVGERPRVGWHPGHYLRNHPGKYNIEDLGADSKFLGIELSFPWVHLEPKAGEYDFAPIDKALAALRPHGKRLFIDVQYKTYNKLAREGSCAPADLIETKAALQYAKKIDYCMALMWRPEVADRYIRLMQALARRYDSEPLVEGVIFEESAVSLHDPVQRIAVKYSEAAYLEQLQRIWQSTRAAFAHKIVLPQLNFTGGGGQRMRELFDFLLGIGAGVTGPDMAPDWHTHASPLYADYAGRMPLAMENQYTVLKRHIDEGATPQVLYDWAVKRADGLRVNYIFWNRGDAKWPGPGWDFKRDLIPMLDRNQWQINRDCPTNLRCDS